MDKAAVLGVLAFLSFMAILFTSRETGYWAYFLVAGIAFAIGWWMLKE